MSDMVLRPLGSHYNVNLLASACHRGSILSHRRWVEEWRNEVKEILAERSLIGWIARRGQRAVQSRHHVALKLHFR